MSRYYKPAIEEFHVGFEYQLLEGEFSIKPKTKKWVKKELTSVQLHGTNTWFLQECIEKETIRVKHLDKEDIESLGFKEYVHGYGVDFRNKTHKIAWWFNDEGIEIREITTSGIGEKCVFSGTIKNKSELARLLEQLNINN